MVGDSELYNGIDIAKDQFIHVIDLEFVRTINLHYVGSELSPIEHVREKKTTHSKQLSTLTTFKRV